MDVSVKQNREDKFTNDACLHLLSGPCPVFYPVHLFSCDVDAQLSHQRFGDRPGGLEAFGFPLLPIFASRSSIPFTRSLSLSLSLSPRLLILAHYLESRGCRGCLRCQFHSAEHCQ